MKQRIQYMLVFYTSLLCNYSAARQDVFLQQGLSEMVETSEAIYLRLPIRMVPLFLQSNTPRHLQTIVITGLLSAFIAVIPCCSYISAMSVNLFQEKVYVANIFSGNFVWNGNSLISVWWQVVGEWVFSERVRPSSWDNSHPFSILASILTFVCTRFPRSCLPTFLYK